MRTMYRLMAGVLALTLVAESTVGAVGSKDAAYFGGTITVPAGSFLYVRWNGNAASTRSATAPGSSPGCCSTRRSAWA